MSISQSLGFKAMTDTNEEYKLNLLEKLIVEELKKRKAEVDIKTLANDLREKRDLIERATSKLESRGYIVRTKDTIELSWAAKRVDEEWRPKGAHIKLRIKTPSGESEVTAIIIKGAEIARRTREPIEALLKTINKVKTIAKEAATQKALHYAYELTMQVINEAEKLNIITRRHASKLREATEPDKKHILTTISRIEKTIIKLKE